MKKIWIINFEGVYKSSLYGLSDIFDYCSVHFGQRFILTIVESLPDDCSPLDYIILPACSSEAANNIANSGFKDQLAILYRSGAVVCSVCLSAFVLAESKLLNGRRATTHWKGAELLQNRFPEVSVDKSRILIKDERIITTGGLTSYNDLALFIIKNEYSSDTASSIARIFLVNSQRETQLPYIESRFRSYNDPLIDELQTVVTIEYSAAQSVESVSKKLNISSRQLNRRCLEETGLSVSSFIRSLRLGYAADLLDSGSTVTEAAAAVGYMDVPAFCRRFKTEKGISPGHWKIR